MQIDNQIASHSWRSRSANSNHIPGGTVLVLHRRQQTLINGCKAFESAGLSPADSDSAQNDSISGCRSGSRNETAAMRNFGSPYGRYWMVRPSSSLAASEAGQGAPKSRSTPCHTNSTAQSPRSASKSARTRSTWQGRTSVMRCTAKQAQARNQVSLHAIRAGEGGREFRQSPPFERFAAYRRATTSRELCSARFLLSRCPFAQHYDQIRFRFYTAWVKTRIHRFGPYVSFPQLRT